jgi:hypothetical protein
MWQGRKEKTNNMRNTIGLDRRSLTRLNALPINVLSFMRQAKTA